MGVELVGRDRDLEELETRCAARRLVTIVGPGGVGKTSLALAAAERLASQGPVGVVDLTAVSDAGAVRGWIAAQLGFDSFDALLASPDAAMVIVIDNCEHLLDEAAAAVVQVLGASDQLSIIATSRAPLEVPGESVLQLAPLAVPRVGDDPRGVPSVQLFIERCHDAGVETADADIDDIGDLCRQLDGLPLALEIAAARTRSMSLAEISARLADSGDVLERPRFRGDPRHRSVTSTIRWSYDCLSPPSQHLLERLSVFAGFFSQRDAQTLSDVDAPIDESLDELVHASLVVADTAGRFARFRLLDLVRRFALAALAERGTISEACDQSVDYIADRAAAFAAELERSWRAVDLSDLTPDYEDVVEAVRWCIEHDTSPARAYRLCPPLAAIAHQGHAVDIAVHMGALLARFPDDGTAGRALARAALATAEYAAGDPDSAVQLATDALDDHPDRDFATTLLLRALGRAHHALGHNDLAVGACRQGADIARELGVVPLADELGIAAAIGAADAGRAADALAELATIADHATHSSTAGWAAAAHGWVLVRVDPSAALRDATMLQRDAAGAESRSIIAVALRSQAFAQLALGNLGDAAATASQLLEDLVARGALSNMRMAVDVAAALAYRSGHANWRVLAATARALPITSPACSMFEPFPLPPVTDAPLPRNRVVNVLRATLHDIANEDIPTAAPAIAPAGDARIDTTGPFWTVDFEGRSIVVRASKGMRDILRLVVANGKELHCTDLAEVRAEQATTGDVIDAAARGDYERRIRDLQDDIDDAERSNDYARSYRMQVELDALIEHLTATLGQGGKIRRGSDTTERARTAVTHRLRTTIRQLHKAHPTLGRHLDQAIKTGAYCSYQPERPTLWTVL
ncbi:MAG TPA: hypothetical protein VL916_15245 [Ilumatobacteraceae bacterium]|nr:hypothetical protein [Ilumatobacteraceae bacterium]